MKIIQRYFYLLLFSAVLLLAAAYGAGVTDSPPCFLVPGQTEPEAISIFDAGDGNYYVFLPSYADMTQVTISLSGKQRLSLDDTPLSDGMNFAGFELETPYDFIINEQQAGSLCFYRSANIAAMYINTVSGDMGPIHADKNHEEHASVKLYTADGAENYSDALSILKGRGNSTWDSDKRPYALTLSSDGDLLGMGAASSWVLLANAYDPTNLNNKLVMDLAARVGLPWSPESRWVDLYLNGEYAGLYLLTEKVEVHSNRLDLDTESGEFLCKVDLNERWEVLRYPFLTGAGRTVEISYPKILTESGQAGIEYLVNQMEQELLSGTDLRTSDIIDLDSWIRRYLIDEIAGNVDSDHISSYFYYSDGKFYAGPVWDYDLAFGNCSRNQDPCSFIARNLLRADYYRSDYHSALYANESFYNRMTEIYRRDFVPVLRQLVNGEIEDISSQISKAAQSNALRWDGAQTHQESEPFDGVNTPQQLQAYLSQRIRFLDRVWLEDTEYCSIEFETSPAAEYLNTAVEKGQPLEVSFLDLESSVWYDTATGAAVDLSLPVSGDMVLTTHLSEDANPLDSPVSTEHDDGEYVPVARDYITFLSIAVLLTTLMGFAIADIVQRRRERSAADERKRSEVSP